MKSKASRNGWNSRVDPLVDPLGSLECPTSTWVSLHWILVTLGPSCLQGYNFSPRAPIAKIPSPIESPRVPLSDAHLGFDFFLTFAKKRHFFTPNNMDGVF